MKVKRLIGAKRLYSRPLVSEQRQELGHSVVLVHLEMEKKENSGRGTLNSLLTAETNRRNKESKMGHTVTPEISQQIQPVAKELLCDSSVSPSVQRHDRDRSRRHENCPPHFVSVSWRQAVHKC